MRDDAAAALADPPETLLDMGAPLTGARTRQPLVEPGAGSRDARRQAMGAARRLVRPFLGMAGKPPLAGRLGDAAGQMSRLPRPGPERPGAGRVEAAGALEAAHEIAVAPGAQPADVVGGGHVGSQAP